MGLALATLTAASCDKPQTQTSAQTTESATSDRPTSTKTAAPTTTPTVSPSMACDTLDRAQCLLATHCTMHHVDDMLYACRPSQGACETGLRQRDKPACEKRDGCTFDLGGCYCPFPGYGSTQVKDKDTNTGGACACGGGAPPRCKKG